MAGTCQTDDLERLKRVLFRTSRGNVVVLSEDIESEDIDGQEFKTTNNNNNNIIGGSKQ
jgi:hypothetical protein